MGTRKHIASRTAYRSEVPDRTRRLGSRDFRSAGRAMLLDDDFHSIDSPNMPCILENVKFPNSFATVDKEYPFVAMG